MDKINHIFFFFKKQFNTDLHHKREKDYHNFFFMPALMQLNGI